ncbi:hypothetical protein F5Y18DRAFT_378391 [Xylariaceae sp. FL1019]|nr:hypothetical protein F5Y18DRAFT_378391 [Xylariaceae sp. FL1019]
MSDTSQAIQSHTAARNMLESLPSVNFVLAQDSNDYTDAKSRPWSQTCWAPAAGFIFPENAQQVADVLAAAVKTGTRFALRCRGHNPNPGFSSIGEGGVVIDIHKLSSLSLDRDASVLHVGAGATWGDVYSFLEEQGLSAIGGRDTAVGVAGFLLGGGYPALPNLHGTGADGVQSFEIVLADSTIVTADIENHADLFRALKGGGSNFGIVTSIGLHVHPLIKVQYSIELYNEADYANIMQATAKVQKTMEFNSKINLFTNVNSGFIVVGLLSADGPDARPDEFKPFTELQSLMNTVTPTTNGTILSLTRAMIHETTPQRRTVGTVTTGVSADLYNLVYDAWKQVILPLPSDVRLYYTIQPVSASAVEAGERNGGNTMGIDKTSQCWWVFTAEWNEESHDGAVTAAIDDIVKRTQDLSREKGLLLDYLCMNFASGAQDVIRSYGAENVAKLQATAAKYDPTGVFQNLQNDGFLLRRL